MSFALAFLVFTCDCCGRTLSGGPVYKAGLRMCAPCAAGEHRHPRTAARAA